MRGATLGGPVAACVLGTLVRAPVFGVAEVPRFTPSDEATTVRVGASYGSGRELGRPLGAEAVVIGVVSTLLSTVPSRTQARKNGGRGSLFVRRDRARSAVGDRAEGAATTGFWGE